MRAVFIRFGSAKLCQTLAQLQQSCFRGDAAKQFGVLGLLLNKLSKRVNRASEPRRLATIGIRTIQSTSEIMIKKPDTNSVELRMILCVCSYEI